MSGQQQRRAWVEALMGTVFSVHVIGDGVDDDAMTDAVARCFAELRELEQIFSPFREESDISRIRRNERTIEEADERVREVAAACVDAEASTAGLFTAWWKGWFDPTGYVKGWAVEEACRHHLDALLEHPGIDAVGLNAGGDMRLRTAATATWSWNIGIADPDAPGEMIATVDLRDGAVATSGTAERGARITDPRTGLPATAARSVTVIADSLTEADVWATAGVVAGEDLSWISRAPQTRGILVGADGTVRRWIAGVEVSAHAAA